MIGRLASLLPRTWRTYIEPMAGGAALFFSSRPVKAILADTNSELITFYTVLRDDPAGLLRRLRSLTASPTHYYALRASRPRGEMQQAVRFAYLNRLAWNGLYRVNRAGHFNVPIGDRLPAVMWNEAELLKASAALSTARLVAGDFRVTLRESASGDFVYLDPPYPRGCRDKVGFNRYASDVFTASDHHDLADIISEMTTRSIKVMLTVRGVNHFEEIYSRQMHRVRFKSKALIACNGADRRNVTELILTNY
jgi:DNA adenine methylase